MFKRLSDLIRRRSAAGAEGAVPQGERAATGESFEEAIIIHARRTDDGISKEYEWIENHFGRRNQDWKFVIQSLTHHENRPYDIISIRLADGSAKQIYFDISSFFG